MIIEKSDAIGWFDTGSQTSAPGQAGCNIQIGNLASDWNDGGLSKGRVSLIVNDKCPYFQYIKSGRCIIKHVKKTIEFVLYI